MQEIKICLYIIFLSFLFCRKIKAHFKKYKNTVNIKLRTPFKAGFYTGFGRRFLKNIKILLMRKYGSKMICSILKKQKKQYKYMEKIHR